MASNGEEGPDRGPDLGTDESLTTTDTDRYVVGKVNGRTIEVPEPLFDEILTVCETHEKTTQEFIEEYHEIQPVIHALDHVIADLPTLKEHITDGEFEAAATMADEFHTSLTHALAACPVDETEHIFHDGFTAAADLRDTFSQLADETGVQTSTGTDGTVQLPPLMKQFQATVHLHTTAKRIDEIIVALPLTDPDTQSAGSDHRHSTSPSLDPDPESEL